MSEPCGGEKKIHVCLSRREVVGSATLNLLNLIVVLNKVQFRICFSLLTLGIQNARCISGMIQRKDFCFFKMLLLLLDKAQTVALYLGNKLSLLISMAIFSSLITYTE